MLVLMEQIHYNRDAMLILPQVTLCTIHLSSKLGELGLTYCTTWVNRVLFLNISTPYQLGIFHDLLMIITTKKVLSPSRTHTNSATQINIHRLNIGYVLPKNIAHCNL